MCSASDRGRRFRVGATVAVALAIASGATAFQAAAIGETARPALRVCADPNNLPFTNLRGEGFENAIAQVIAGQMGRRVEYYWQPQRRGFLRTTLQAHRCDVVMSVPATLERLRVTRPYYRSTYMFVSRRDRSLDVRSFDDARLRSLDVGIQITGEDYENPPAAQALAARGLVDRVRGYPVYGDYSQPLPQRTIIDAIVAGTVDIAVIWGPVAGYFATRAAVPLRVEPVTSRRGVDLAPFVFDLSIGVRRDDVALSRSLDSALRERAAQIDRILRQFGIPRAT